MQIVGIYYIVVDADEYQPGTPGKVWTEEEADIEATANLLLRLKKATKGLRLVLGISTFVPKAHTPFQLSLIHI